ncbi:hypothetical protein DV736_g4557, partial [Chaetothyriales sp. CBS 134916]
MADDSPQHAEAPTHTNAPTLTHRDIEILIAGFRSFKSAPEVDNAQLTAALGLSNPRSSTNAWRNLIKKLQGDQVPVLASGSKDGPKARGSAKSRATKTPKLMTADVKTENKVKKRATMSTAPSLGASENITTTAPVAKANNTGVHAHPADTVTPSNTGSNFQSKCKEAASALIPATPDLTGGEGFAADTPTKSEPATPTPAPSAPAPLGGKNCGSGDADPAITVVEEEAKPTKKACKAPVKKVKGRQANSETGTLDAGADKSAPKKRKASAKKAAKGNAPVDSAEDAAAHEPDEPKPKRQRKALGKISAASKQAKKTAARKNNNKATEAEAALFSAEKAKAEAKKEHVKKAVQEANAVLIGEVVDGDTTSADDAEATDYLNAAIAAAFDDHIDSLLDLNTAITTTSTTDEAMTAALIEDE